jgi:uncharacterized protein YigA (DUF484 family)
MNRPGSAADLMRDDIGPGPDDEPPRRFGTISRDLRDLILSEPEAILEDRDVMSALVSAHDRAMGTNVIDLRGIAMQRMESRLARLEDTHRSVIAAAYENLAGTNQVHRAILHLLDPVSFEAFLAVLGGDVAQTLRVDCVRLVLESRETADDPALRRLGQTLCVTEAGFIDSYVEAGRNALPRQVTLRQTMPESNRIYAERSGWIRSEALLRLDLGPGRLPGLLVLGAEDPHRFKSAHGTDLLAFFGSVFERSMRRWLA